MVHTHIVVKSLGFTRMLASVSPLGGSTVQVPEYTAQPPHSNQLRYIAFSNSINHKNYNLLGESMTNYLEFTTVRLYRVL